MTHDARTLVVGATGFLGMEIVRLLRGAGTPVRAVVRPTADAKKRSVIQAHGAELVTADLKDLPSLRSACHGIAAIISTASATISRQDGDSIESVDKEGQLALVDAAEQAGVRHFVFISFPPSNVDFALQRAKRSVETRLRESRMSFTVLQPTDFTEVWLSAALGFDPMGGRARILGDGTRPVSWISFHDVARFAAKAIEGGKLAGTVLPLGGPDPLSPLQVLKFFEELGAPQCTVEYVPESELEAQLANAKDALGEAYTALMLSTARGQVVDPRPARELLPGRQITVREYVTRIVNNFK